VLVHGIEEGKRMSGTVKMARENRSSWKPKCSFLLFLREKQVE
jgi:hypothetical protein